MVSTKLLYRQHTELQIITRSFNAIPIMPKAYRSRGEAWQHLKEQKKADADLAVAKALETDTTPSVQL